MRCVPLSRAGRIRRAAGAVVALVVAACDGSSHSSPTAPAGPPPVAPPAADLTGTWTGKMTVTWDEMDGGGSCEVPLTARFLQTGAAVQGTLRQETDCFSPFGREDELDGRLEGDRLFARFLTRGGWHALGQVVGDELTLSAFNVRWVLRRT